MEANQSLDRKGRDGRIVAYLIIFFIVAIHLAFALPDFLRFAEPTRQFEAKTKLRAIYSYQVAHFKEYNTYAGSENCFEELAWSPEGEHLYAYYCGRDVIKNTKGDACPVPDVEHGVSETGFTVIAVGNVDNDDVCDVWTMNDAKVLRNVVVDP